MTEIINPIKQIESYDSPIVEEKIRGLSQSHSYSQWLQSRINIFQKRNNLEMVNILNTCKEVYLKFHPITTSTIKLNGWKNKSSIEFIEKPDSFEIITFQREDQDHNPKEMRHEISKEQINKVISAINELWAKKTEKDRQFIKTKEIARNYCILANLRLNNQGHELFPNGSFEFGRFFSDRALHLSLNLICRLLDNLNIIKYRAGKIQVLKTGFSFQLNLPN